MENENLRSVTGRPHYRIAGVERAAVNVDKRTVELTFASEAPVERYWGIEVLDMSAVNMGRWQNNPPFMENHRARRGVIESGTVKDRKLAGTARLSRNQAAEDLLRDMADGIAPHTSVGYMFTAEPREMKLEEMDDELAKMCVEKGMKAYRCAFEPIEGSSVDIPADISVGLGKRGVDYYDLDDVSDPGKIAGAIRGFKPESTTVEPLEVRGKVMTPEEEKKAAEEAKRVEESISKTADDRMKSELDRRDEIEAIAKRFSGRVSKLDELKASAIRNKISVERFKGAIADAIGDTEPIETPASHLGLTEKEKRGYRFTNAIRHLLGEKVDAGFELECSKAVAEAMGVKARGILVPYDVQGVTSKDFRLHPDFLQFTKGGKRDLVISGETDLMATDLLAGEFIEMLRNKMVLRALGARVLTGLVGNVAIPRQTGTATIVWETEATGISSESTQTFDQVTMSPNEIGAYTEISRKFLQQSTPGAEGLVRSDLATAIALGIDAAGFVGGGGTTPQGIYGTSGIGSIDGAGLTWDSVVEFETDVADGNAEAASCSYVATPTIFGLLKTRPKVATYPSFLMDPDGTMNGYRVARTKQITAGYMFFGDFSQVLIGEWGVLDLTVNPFVKDIEGLVRVTAHQSVDVGIRHAGAFAASINVS